MTAGRGNGQTTPEVVRCKVAVLGAGIAGLNAAFVASAYLSPGQRMVMVDRRTRPGGMWNDAYDYVRLHQPHPFFTAGDIAWDWDKPPEYLATGAEVQRHLQHCFERIDKRCLLDARLGYAYLRHEERADGVRVYCAPVDGGQPLVIEAETVIYAFCASIEHNPPLEFTSDQVRSLSPDDPGTLADAVVDSEAPIYVVGGGKTAMDTAHMLLTRFHRRAVRMYIGAGTFFLSRDLILPTGVKRWTAPTGTEVFLDIAARFDGDNEAELTDYMRDRYMLAPSRSCRHHRFGFLSQAELDVIAGGADELHMGYVQDVVDRAGHPTLLLRSGASRRVEPGSVFVNATGYLSRNNQPYMPYLSAGGRVVALTVRSSTVFLPAYAGYLLTHAAMRGVLAQLPLYELDWHALPQTEVIAPTVMTHALYNLMLLRDGLPMWAQRQFGADTQRWYPLPRQLLSIGRLMRYQKRHPDHLRRSLDRVRERFGIRCGLLQHPSVEPARAVDDTPEFDSPLDAVISA